MLFADTFDFDSPRLPARPQLAPDQLLPATPQFTDLPTWAPTQYDEKPAAAVTAPPVSRIPQLLPY